MIRNNMSSKCTRFFSRSYLFHIMHVILFKIISFSYIWDKEHNNQTFQRVPFDWIGLVVWWSISYFVIQHLLTWTQVSHLFTMDPFDSLKLQIISDCCAIYEKDMILKRIACTFGRHIVADDLQKRSYL